MEPTPRNKGGRPKGSTDEQRGKRVWTAALRKATVRDKKLLGEIVEAFLNKCKSGDVQAVKELGDRLEGKVAQGLIAPVGAVKIRLIKGDENL